MARKNNRSDIDKLKRKLEEEEKILSNEENNINKEEEKIINNENSEEQNLEDENKDNNENEKSKENDNEQNNDEESGNEDKKNDEENKDKKDEKYKKENNETNDKFSDDRTDNNERRKLGPNNGNNEKDSKQEERKDDKTNIKDAVKNKAADKVKEQIGQNEAVDKAMKAKELATKAIATGKSLVSGSALLAKILVNPVTWIGIALLIVIAAISSSVAIIGGNDYNKACDAQGIGSVTVATDADDFTRQSAIAAWLMSTPFEINNGNPMSKEQASGILGNFIQESYSANPKAIQGDHAITKWQSCNNDCVLGWGSVNGKAVGIAQWDGGRRIALANFAKTEGTEWHDLTTQLKYLKTEIDSGYEKDMLVKGGFADPSKTVNDYTEIWLTKFERAGVGVLPKRQEYANGFYSQYAGGGPIPSSGGLTTQCVGGSGGAIDASNLVQLALQISYTREEKAAGLGYGVCGSLVRCGDSFSKPEYIEAKKQAEETTGADGYAGLTASCDRLVATLLRLTGVDESFPWGGSSAQIAYMNNSNKWANVSCQERQPGDVIARPGHIMIYLGNIDGRDTMASASIASSDRVGPNGKGRSAHLSDLKCNGASWYGDGSNAKGWRMVKGE